MKTVIFILVLSAIAAPAFTAAGDAIACAANTGATCNMCLRDGSDVALNQCFDCKAGYSLTVATTSTGTCTRCATGKGIAAGTATATTLAAARPAVTASCTADCHASCLNCLLPATANSCTNCAHGMWANAFANGATTCTACSTTPGKGRTAVATTAPDLTDKEVEATVCSVTCATGTANCKGTAAADALYCSANYWLGTTGCTACDMGKAKAASTAAPTTAEAATSCAICAANKYYTATGCMDCPAAKPTRTAPTTAPNAVENDSVCSAAGGSGSSATLIQALCGASVAAYALF